MNLGFLDEILMIVLIHMRLTRLFMIKLGKNLMLFLNLIDL